MITMHVISLSVVLGLAPQYIVKHALLTEADGALTCEASMLLVDVPDTQEIGQI